jgi:hypothetical protein
LLARLARGGVTNVAFADLQGLVEGFGFELRRVSGSHHTYVHPEVRELLNLRTYAARRSPIKYAK